MWRRLPLLGLACLLAIPLVRFAILEANEREVESDHRHLEGA